MLQTLETTPAIYKPYHTDPETNPAIYKPWRLTQAAIHILEKPFIPGTQSLTPLILYYSMEVDPA
jgi:hypothetical protein